MKHERRAPLRRHAPAWRSLARPLRGARPRASTCASAFARDAGRFAAFSQRGAATSSPTCRRTCSTRRRSACCSSWRASAALERSATRCSPASAINNTEGRAVKHWRCARRAARRRRSPRRCTPRCDAMLAYRRAGARRRGASRDVVNIGIGGSDLGPQMAVAALDAFAIARQALPLRLQRRRPRPRRGAAPRATPTSTLFLVASKTFTTQETMTNARSAQGLVRGAGRQRDIAAPLRRAHHQRRGGARSSASPRTFGFWDWVGGRYSLWSAIGLPIAIAIGADGFRELLAGAHAMDEHFASAPLERNLPVRLGLLDVWYRNFHGFASRSIAPYHQRPAPPAGVPAAARDGKQRQARRSRRAAPLPFAHHAGGVGRAGHQRPACLLPDAAPGHATRAGRVHPGKEPARRRTRSDAWPATSACCSPTAWRRRRR